MDFLIYGHWRDNSVWEWSYAFCTCFCGTIIFVSRIPAIFESESWGKNKKRKIRNYKFERIRTHKLLTIFACPRMSSRQMSGIWPLWSHPVRRCVLCTRSQVVVGKSRVKVVKLASHRNVESKPATSLSVIREGREDARKLHAIWRNWMYRQAQMLWNVGKQRDAAKTRRKKINGDGRDVQLGGRMV